MIKYFILIGIILVMSVLPNIESMSILQQFKTSHKNLLNKITNIRNIEYKLYNSIHKNPNKKKAIVDEINKLAIKRDQLFKSIQDQTTLFKNLTPKITKEDTLVKEIESELSKLKYHKDKSNNIINNRRITNINKYYNARSLSYISLFKTILLYFILLLIIAILVYYNIFPYTIGKIIIIIILIIMIIHSFSKYSDILARDNMNFNEYDFDNDTNDRLNNNLDELGNINSLSTKMCIDQECCSKGTIYDKNLGQCRLPIR